VDKEVISLVDALLIASENGSDSSLALFHALELLGDTLALLVYHQIVNGPG
jgi:hypothetical protein